jgi:hypothetical protein
VSRPRILLLAPLGWSIRNYLRTDVADLLARHADLTVATPAFEERVLRSDCERRGFGLVPLRPYAFRPLRGYLIEIDKAAFFARLKTVASRVKWERDLRVSRLRARFRRRMNHLIARVLGPLPDAAWRRFGRFAYAPPGGLRVERELLDRTRPDLVFSTVPLANHYERPVLWLADDRRIPIVTAITSWDNLSSKPRLPIRFVRTLVWGEHMRGELLRLYPDIAPESVAVTGVPQFDLYARAEHRPERAEFLHEIGAAQDVPVVLYSGVPATLMESEPRVVGRFADALHGEMGDGITLLYRPHPKAAPSWYQEALRGRPQIRCTPTNEEGAGNPALWSPSDAHVRALTGSLAHAAVNVNFASTMTLDAAVHDLPVANVAFDDVGPHSEISAGLREMYTFDHYRPAVDLRAVRVCTSHEELLAQVRAYLADRARDAEGRRRLVEMQCGKVDGGAGRRVAAAVLEVLGIDSGPLLREARAGHGLAP